MSRVTALRAYEKKKHRPEYKEYKSNLSKKVRSSTHNRYKALIRRSIKKFGHEPDFDLLYYENLINLGCYYCGTSLRSGAQGCTLDRINNKIGYIKSNILPCCAMCNYIKGSQMTVEETKVMVTALVEFRSKNARSTLPS